MTVEVQEARELVGAPADKGLIVELADAITEQDHFAVDGSRSLYVYKNGVYRPHGGLYIQQQVKTLMKQRGRLASWSSRRADEVAAYIAVDARELWDRPPLDRINLSNGVLDLE